MHNKVTIGIPVFRVEQFIRRTMESVLSQTYDNIEFLVIDDASDDKTLDVLHSIQERHPRGHSIRLLSHDYNMGVSETRNQIIDEAKGDYLYFVDSDDIIDKDTISLLMSQIEKYNLDIVFGSYERIELSGERSLFQYPRLLFENSDSFADFAYKKYAGFQASACNYLVRLSLIHENNLRFFKADFWEDMVFTFNLVTIAQRAVLLPNITYTYLCRENSLSNSWHNEMLEKQIIVQYFKAVDLLKGNTNVYKKKSYYPNRCYFALMSDFYIICNVLKKHRYISPRFKNEELHFYMKHPSPISEIVRFEKYRAINIFLWFLGTTSPNVCIFFIRIIGKIKGLL